MALAIVDNLRVDVIDAAEDGQAGSLRRALHLPADALVNMRPDAVFGSFLDHVLLGARAGLADLLAERLSCVPDSLIFVRIGGPKGPDLGCYLPQSLLVVTGQHQMSLLVDLHVDSIGQQKFDGMRVAEREVHDLAFYVGAIADSDDVHLAREACGNALYRVGRQRTREAVQRRVLVRIATELQTPVRLV